MSIRFPFDIKRALARMKADTGNSQEALVVGFTQRGLIDAGYLEKRQSTTKTKKD